MSGSSPRALISASIILVSTMTRATQWTTMSTSSFRAGPACSKAS